MNGWVTIGTKLDKKQLEKDIKDAERQLQQYEKEAKRLAEQKTKLEFDTSQAEAKLDALQDKEQEVRKTMTEVAPGGERYQQLQIELDDILNKQVLIAQKYEYQQGKLGDIDNRFKEINSDTQRIEDNLEDSKEQLAGVNAEIDRAKKLEQVKHSAEGLKTSMQGLVKTALRWALAIFGVRSAYNFIRSSISTLSQYNEQIGTDIEYIRFALATTLQPIVERLIALAYNLLSAIASIIYSLFKVNIFANATTDAFRKQNKALGGSVKKAKQLQKTLAGFDEMNILQDNGDVVGGGGGGGVPFPSMNLSELKPIEWDKVEKWFDDLEVKVRKGSENFRGLLGKILKDLGFSEAFREAVDLTFAGKEDIYVGLIRQIKGVVIMIKGFLQGNADEIKRGFKVWLDGLGTMLMGVFEDLLGEILVVLVAIRDMVWNWFLKPVGDLIGQRIEDIKQKFRDLKAKLQPYLDLMKFSISYFWEDIKNKAFQKVNDIVLSFKNGINSIKSFFSNLPTYINNIINQIASKLSYFGSHTGEVIGGAFKSVINSVISRAQNVLNSPVNAINSLISQVNQLPGVSMKKLSTFSLPRLAKGGIINQPGRGVMIGSAIAGESGREGVIPLTDSQQMAMLGEAIGKFININATVPVYVGNRMIAREIKRINAEDDFAFNRS